MAVITTITQQPRLHWLTGGGGWNGGTPGVLTVNFDPTDADYVDMVTNIPDGSLIISLGTLGPDCEFNCAPVLYIKGCSTCDVPAFLIVNATGA